MVNSRSAGGHSALPTRLARAVVALLLIAGLLAPSTLIAQDTEVPTPTAGLAGTSQGMTILASEVTPTSVHVSARFTAVQDSYISSGFPDSNFGSANNLILGWVGGSQQASRILLQFDLSAIPQNAHVRSASISAFQFNAVPADDAPMEFLAQVMSVPWNEQQVTWNNANNLGGTPLRFASVDSSPGWKTVDATNIVRTWVSRAAPNNGLFITGDENPGNRFRRFNSREEPGRAPFVEVEWDVTCDNIAPTVGINPLDRFRPGQFEVSWQGFDSAPPGCTPTGIATFDVEYSVAFGSWVRWHNQTNRTSDTFNFAGNGQNVQFRVRARDNAGNLSSFSSIVSTTVDTEPPVAFFEPLPEFIITPTFVLRWSATDNLSGPARYDVQVRKVGEQWFDLVRNTTATSYQVTGAEEGATYEARIRATDNVGNVQPWPAHAQGRVTIFTTPVAEVIQPPAFFLNATVPPATTFPLSWTGFAAPGTTISGFEIHFRRLGGPWHLWQTFPGTQLSANFPFAAMNLGDGIYQFQALAIGPGGSRETLVPNNVEATKIINLNGTFAPKSLMPIAPHTMH